MMDSPLELGFPAVKGKTIVGRLDGGEVTSDAGVMLIGEVSAGVFRGFLPSIGVTGRPRPPKISDTIIRLGIGKRKQLKKQRPTHLQTVHE